ncbi:Tol-pal system protein YbgF [Chitinispirillum alkaliphilum]|nr:Tol-pal system protein YbgF [Chitinispirillum alkaliphilum]
MKKGYLLILVPFLLVFSQGCTHLTVLRTEELREVQTRVDSLHDNLTTLQRQLLEEQKANSEMIRLLRADQQVRFNEVERRVSGIEISISENLMRLAQIDQKTTEFSRRLEEKLAFEASEEMVRRREIEKLFEIAMSDFTAARYDLAISGFEDIKALFPESEEAIKSQYWIAESYYAKRDFETAERVYLEFIRSHPERTEICVALYKLGLSYERQEKMKSREMVWRKLIKQCPESQEAQMVQNILEIE